MELQMEMIFQSVQSEPMLQNTFADYASLSDVSTSKLKNAMRYREKEGDTPTSHLSYSPHVSLLRQKCKVNQPSQNDSLDTCESEQSIGGRGYGSRGAAKRSKHKVQLCKNFVEKGYCPYETRCRFAHGVDELRAKDTLCSSDLYRTRRCKVFFQKNECKFGERCNFMHDNRNLTEIKVQTAQAVKSALRCEFLEVGVAERLETRAGSRLLELLCYPSAQN